MLHKLIVVPDRGLPRFVSLPAQRAETPRQLDRWCRRFGGDLCFTDGTPFGAWVTHAADCACRAVPRPPIII